MLVMDERGYEYLMDLQRELTWLRENHPDKKVLIQIAESHLGTIRQAGSCDSLTVTANGATTFKLGNHIHGI